MQVVLQAVKTVLSLVAIRRQVQAVRYIMLPNMSLLKTLLCRYYHLFNRDTSALQTKTLGVLYSYHRHRRKCTHCLLHDFTKNRLTPA